MSNDKHIKSLLEAYITINYYFIHNLKLKEFTAQLSMCL